MVNSGEDPALQEQADDILGLDAELFCKLLDGRTFDEARGLQLACARSDVRAQASGNTVFKRERLRRRNVVAVKASAFASLMPFGSASGATSAAPAATATAI